MIYFLFFLLLTTVSALFDNSTDVIALKDPESLAAFRKGDPGYQHVLLFFAHWCPYCQRFAPTYEWVAHNVSETEKFKFGAVNCAKNKQLCDFYPLEFYPTVVDLTNNRTMPSIRTRSAVRAWVLGDDNATDGEVEAEASTEQFSPDKITNRWSSDVDKVCDTDKRRHDALLAVQFILAQPLPESESGRADLAYITSILARGFPDAVVKTRLEKITRNLHELGRLTEKSNLELLMPIDDISIPNLPSDIMHQGENATLSESELKSVSEFLEEIAVGSEAFGSKLKCVSSYPSTLWTLFHILSIAPHATAVQAGGEFRPNNNQNENTIVNPSEDDDLEVAEVQEAIRLVTLRYFPCSECSMHFNSMFERGALDRKSSIWSWRNEKLAEKCTRPFEKSLRDENRTVDSVLTASASFKQCMNDDWWRPSRQTFGDVSVTFLKKAEQQSSALYLWRVHNSINTRTFVQQFSGESLLSHVDPSGGIFMLEYPPQSPPNVQAEHRQPSLRGTHFDETVGNHTSSTAHASSNLSSEQSLPFNDIDVRWPSPERCSSCRVSSPKPSLMKDKLTSVRSIIELKGKNLYDDSAFGSAQGFSTGEVYKYLVNNFWV